MFIGWLGFLYVLFLTLDGIGQFSLISSFIKLLSVFSCFLAILFHAERKYQFLAAASLTMLADCFLLFTDFFGIGILLFILIQLCYTWILSGLQQAGITGMGIFAVIFVLLLFIQPPLYALALGYVLAVIQNLIRVIRYMMKKPSPFAYWMGAVILLLACCDLHIALQYLSLSGWYFEFFAPWAVWLFYLPSQYALVRAHQFREK